MIKRFYSDPTAVIPNAPNKNDHGHGAKAKKAPNDDSYAEHYNKVKELSAIKKWNETKFNKMLGDKKAFNREWRAVSFCKSLISFLFFSIKINSRL